MGGFLVSFQLHEAALTPEVALAVSPVHFSPLTAAVLFVRHLFYGPRETCQRYLLGGCVGHAHHRADPDKLIPACVRDFIGLGCLARRQKARYEHEESDRAYGTEGDAGWWKRAHFDHLYM